MHKRSLFPSQLALIKNKHIFTLYNNTNCSYCLERIEKDSLLGVHVLKSKRTESDGKPLWGAQIILGTPLFSADVFQWARFRNAPVYSKRHLHHDYMPFFPLVSHFPTFVTSHAKMFLTASVRMTERTASKRIRNGCKFFLSGRVERLNGCKFFRTLKSNGWTDAIFFWTVKSNGWTARQQKQNQMIQLYSVTRVFVTHVTLPSSSESDGSNLPCVAKKYISRLNQEIFYMWNFDVPDMQCLRANLSYVVFNKTCYATFVVFTIFWREVWENNWFLSLILWGVKKCLNGKCFLFSFHWKSIFTSVVWKVMSIQMMCDNQFLWWFLNMSFQFSCLWIYKA